MDSACLPNTAGYTFNGGHVGGQAIFESVHPPLTQGGGGRRRRAARKSTRRRRSARKVARRSARKTARRSARKVARRVQGRRAVYREAEKTNMSGGNSGLLERAAQMAEEIQENQV